MLKLRVVTISTAMRRFSISQHCIALQRNGQTWSEAYCIVYSIVNFIVYFVVYF